MCTLPAQKEITLTEPRTGLRIIVINKDYPLLKILLPGQSTSERGIEVEFPEHVTGLNGKTNITEHLYLVSQEQGIKELYRFGKLKATQLNMKLP
jgi:hypothetical protein